MRVAFAAVCVLAMVAPPVMAAEANELSVSQSIRINASPDAVWSYVGDFNGLPTWLPTIAESRIVFGRNNEVGCIRELTRRNGTKVTERLIDYDPAARRLGYTYVDGMVAASDYFPVIVVKDGGGGVSRVEWTARFKRLAYAQDPPPPGQDDKSLTDFYNNVYKLGLEALKKKVEGGQ